MIGVGVVNLLIYFGWDLPVNLTPQKQKIKNRPEKKYSQFFSFLFFFFS